MHSRVAVNRNGNSYWVSNWVLTVLCFGGMLGLVGEVRNGGIFERPRLLLTSAGLRDLGRSTGVPRPCRVVESFHYVLCDLVLLFTVQFLLKEWQDERAGPTAPLFCELMHTCTVASQMNGSRLPPRCQ